MNSAPELPPLKIVCRNGADDSSYMCLQVGNELLAEVFPGRVKRLQGLLDQLLAAVRENREKDARIAELETVLNRTVTVVNELPSVTGLSPVRNYIGLPLAVADLQECYRDAARARNGVYTKMQARAEAAEAKLRAVSDALPTELSVRTPSSEDIEMYDRVEVDAVLARIRAILEGK